MNETNFDWDDLRLFTAVAQHGGLAAASAATGKSAPTLGRRMLALERHLNAELFERLPRGYALTPAGTELLKTAQGIEAQISPIAQPDRNASPVVKISAGVWMTHVLCKGAARLMGSDQLSLRFIAADHVLDIRRREAVIGIRNRRPQQTGLAARRLGRVRFAVFARSSGVKPWARVIGTTPSAQWLEATTKSDPAIEVTDPRSALDLAEAGLARAVLPTFVGEASATLTRIGAPIEPLEHDQWLVTHDAERFEPHVRRTLDRIADLLGKLER